MCRVNSVHASSRCQTGVLHRMRAWTDTVSSRPRMLFSDRVRRRTRVFVLELETRRAGRLPRDFSNPLMYLNDSGDGYDSSPSISCEHRTHAERVSQSSDCSKQLLPDSSPSQTLAALLLNCRFREKRGKWRRYKSSDFFHLVKSCEHN